MRVINREKFPRGLDKPRTINSMKDSILPATAAHAIDFGYIQGACRRLEAMRSSEIDPVEPPTVSELEEALGEAVQKCDLFAKNWRNRIYRIELAHGRLVLGKQLVMGTDAMLQYQYEELRVLAALHVPGLGVPNTFALLPAKRLLLTEFVPGKTIEILAWTSEDVIPACDLAGKTLARLQLARTETIGPIPVEMISRDLAMAPWRLSLREKEILQATLERLAAAEVRIGHVYYDYKPANLIYQNNELLFLIDPPDVWWRGAHLWDYACFRSSMRRHLWRISLRRPYDRHRRTTIRQGLVAFEQGYLTSFANRHPEPPLFALAVQLFELQRNAVFMTMKKGKVNMARQVNRITLPLLEMEKRWLFRRLARELPR
ncbi:MAG TPA: hypothetical protein DHU55_11020 [Blastocatellia bacterium]|jgi:hypothetical protein|nr:hypothetical protein [Blastocatellia bacterium]